MRITFKQASPLSSCTSLEFGSCSRSAINILFWFIYAGPQNKRSGLRDGLDYEIPIYFVP